MSERNGNNQRRTSRRRRKPLSVTQVQAVVSEAIEVLEHYILEPHRRGEQVPADELARLTNALTQAATAYRGLLDAGDFADDLQTLREQVAALTTARDA